MALNLLLYNNNKETVEMIQSSVEQWQACDNASPQNLKWIDNNIDYVFTPHKQDADLFV